MGTDTAERVVETRCATPVTIMERMVSDESWKPFQRVVPPAPPTPCQAPRRQGLRLRPPEPMDS
ncbi:hypothetical protein O1M63_19260 [Streptomyces mirabilis]|nr:hypothetical protein [Streptomyces mirabilis]